MKKLKLTTLSEAILKDKEAGMVLGGYLLYCSCSCYWEGTEGGATSHDNRNANVDDNAKSQEGCNQYFAFVGDDGIVGVGFKPDAHA